MRYYGYRRTRAGTVTGAETARDAEVLAEASGFGWPVGTTEEWAPSGVLDRSIAAAEALDPDAVLAAYVAGLGSSPRGRQTIISYGWARFLRTASVEDGELPDCGLEAVRGTRHEVDVTEALLRLALGWSWNEQPWLYLPDLEAAVAEGLPAPTGDDRARLAELIALIAARPPGTTASGLEKAMARAKIVAGTDKYQRYGILIGLAEFGVLPSPAPGPSWDRFVPMSEVRAASTGGNPRSDITMPLAGWRGGVDERRAQRLLDL
ncbi:hypothetical protein GCM10011575_43800 [Microlunatus endophyticus]|uniref:Uncharacterized protein n=1 Tax=Microlunatus endophyticus TaxID=1716077 RepID=A0A917W8W9_9ACTN|nr:hypothetical protein [Microlunatus endophyticus]GGL80682.1 hypothetical protein GCM10011575_43800 [Microlunatus endophyticus]